MKHLISLVKGCEALCVDNKVSVNVCKFIVCNTIHLQLLWPS